MSLAFPFCYQNVEHRFSAIETLRFSGFARYQQTTNCKSIPVVDMSFVYSLLVDFNQALKA